MADEKGPDDHVVCVPCDDPGWNYLEDVEDLPGQLRAEIGHFFAVYKDLDPDRHSEVKGWAGRDAALEAVEKARRGLPASVRATQPASALGFSGSAAVGSCGWWGSSRYSGSSGSSRSRSRLAPFAASRHLPPARGR